MVINASIYAKPNHSLVILPNLITTKINKLHIALAKINISRNKYI